MSLPLKDLAELRLRAWQAVEGWGVVRPVKIGDVETKTTAFVEWDWETRKRRAEDLVRWLVSPIDPEER